MITPIPQFHGDTQIGQAVFTNLIVTYNSSREAPRLLADIRQHAPLSRIIVVDNASPDSTADILQAEYPDVLLLKNPQNVGYARAVNQAFELAETEYVFLINPDIRIDSPHLFTALKACLDGNPAVAVAGPLQFKGEGGERRLNFTWSYWTPRAFRFYVAGVLRQHVVAPEPIPVAFLNAGCLFMRSSAFRDVGKLNEKYFLYGEEPDLFLKFIRHGYQCRLVPEVAVRHDRERSLSTVPFLQRLSYRLRGGWNIADALISGIANIVLDRLTGRRPG